MKKALTRRLLAGAAGLMLAATGALVLAAPAQATWEHEQRELKVSRVDFEDDCLGTWVFIHSGEFLRNYDWTVTADGEVFEEFTFPKGEGDSVFVPVEAGTYIEVDFDRSPQGWPATHEWVEPEGCEPETPPETTPPPPSEGPTGTVEATFDCEVFVMTITSTSEVDEELTVAPADSEPIEVTVPAGETVEVEIPSSEGLIVDLQQEGVSVIEGGPFEITSEMWEDAGCNDGEGGELPVTGSSTTLFALGAVALLALGGGLFLIARRRRVTFTAS